MSRTIRRKNLKQNDRVRFTRAEFEDSLSDYLEGEWRGPKRYLGTRSATPADKIWWSDPYARVPHEYIRIGRWYIWEVVQHRDYDHYVAKCNARQYSDAGYASYYSKGGNPGIPRWFVNCYGTRPLRREHQRQIQRAWDNDAWDELSLEPFRHSLAWYYW